MLITIPKRNGAPATKIYVQWHKKESNAPRDVMVLIPGGPGGNHSVYDKVIDTFLEDVDLLLFDPRGCGLSDPCDSSLAGADIEIDDLHAVINHFKLDNPILLGGSYGSIVAMHYAIKYHNIKKLILLAGATSHEVIGKAKKNIQKIGTAEQIKLVEMLFSGEFQTQDEFKEYYKKMAPLYILKLRTVQAPVELPQAPTTKKPIPYNLDFLNIGFKTFFKTFNLQPHLHKISTPTLIMFGADDWVNEPSEGEIMHKEILSSKLVVFKNCGHFIWEDAPEPFFNEFKSFIKQK